MGIFQRWKEKEIAKYSIEGKESLESHSGELCPYDERPCDNDGKCIWKGNTGTAFYCLRYDGEGLSIECPNCSAYIKENDRFCKDCGWENIR